MRLDVVIPAHNEENRIDRTLDAYRTRCADPSYRFLVALDRCTDRTADIVRGHMRRDPRVELLEYPKLGKGGVLMEAFRACDGEYVGFVDADCATPPAEFLRLVDVATSADGAIASRSHPTAVLPSKRSLGRRIASAGFAFVVRRLFRMPYRDTQCGAKVLRRDALERVVPLMSSRDFLFDVDLLFVANTLGYRIVEVPTVWIDRDGSRLHAVRDARRMAASAVRLWLHHRVIPLEPDPEIEPAVDEPERVLVGARS